MAKKKESKDKIGILLIIAGVLIGSGVGQIISTAIGKNVTGGVMVIGIGVGFLAAFVYGAMKKK